MELFMNILQIVMYVLITGCGVTLVNHLLAFLNTKVDELQANSKLAQYEQYNVLIDKAQRIITTIVQSVNQTFVSTLKKSGEFTSESAVEAKETALDLAEQLITSEVADAIQSVYGDVSAFLDVMIEQTVNDLKRYE